MTNPDYTAICLVIDRSGSMQSIHEDAEGGINAFVAEQAASSGTRTVRLATFDDHYEQVCPSTRAADVARFELHPRGRTALLDAMGRGIVEFGEELAALAEHDRPGQVIFAVMTDGLENASGDWTLSRVKALVEQQQTQWGWNVVYLGANQDAISEGARFGVQPGSAMSYRASGVGARSVTRSLSDYMDSAATGAAAAFTEEDRTNAMEND